MVTRGDHACFASEDLGSNAGVHVQFNSDEARTESEQVSLIRYLGAMNCMQRSDFCFSEG